MKTAIIIGCDGQDGQFLADLLAKQQYSIVGIDIDKVYSNNSLWQRKVDISDKNSVFEMIECIKPEEIYYLSAFHQSSEEVAVSLDRLADDSFNINVRSYLNFLEGIRAFSKKTKIFYASSSHIFGNSKTSQQDESTEYSPNSIYGITKLDGLLYSRFYRENHEIFSSVGILYNHESSLRKDKFVSKKIVKAAVEIKYSRRDELMLGAINSQIDWGYAGDYVNAMHVILKHHTPDDFIISSGQKFELVDFISLVFNNLGLDWKKYVRQDTSLLSRKPNNSLFGNPKKLMDATGWSPKYNLSMIAQKMIDEELKTQKIAIH